METLISVLFMGIVGAIIGGVTNSLAIKMLFRPYEAKYIGKWRVPFTPGLIPKRRQEVAKQMGNLVVHHLLTPESIQAKLAEGKIGQEVTLWVDRNFENFLQSDEPLQSWFDRLGIVNLSQKIDGKLIDLFQTKLNDWLEENQTKTVKDVLPASLWIELDEKVPNISDYLVENVKQFLLSEEGRDLIKQHVDQLFEGRGRFAGMLQMFLDNRSIIDRLQNEIVKIMDHEQTKKVVNNVIYKELDKIKAWTVADCFEKLLNKDWKTQLWSKVTKKISVEALLQKPVASLINPEMKHTISHTVIPSIVEISVKNLGIHVKTLMDQFDIPDLVRKQVDSFSTERLEEMVLGISRRELKMITYLGAYLGGAIGILQGFIVLFI